MRNAKTSSPEHATLLRVIMREVPQDKKRELAKELDISFETFLKKIQNTGQQKLKRQLTGPQAHYVGNWLKDHYDIDLPPERQQLTLVAILEQLSITLESNNDASSN